MRQGKIDPATKQELVALLRMVANPATTLFKPDMSNPEYRYYVRRNGTIETKKYTYLSNGKRSKT